MNDTDSHLLAKLGISSIPRISPSLGTLEARVLAWAAQSDVGTLRNSQLSYSELYSNSVTLRTYASQKQQQLLSSTVNLH